MTGSAQFAAFVKIVLSYYTLQLGREAAISISADGPCPHVPVAVQKHHILEGVAVEHIAVVPIRGEVKVLL